MKFEPKTEQQLFEEKEESPNVNKFLLSPGDYPFEVISAQEKNSKAGNPMIELKLKFFDHDRHIFCRDWLVQKTVGKIRNFCEATGMMDIYNSAELRAEHCMSRSGWARLGVKKREGTDFENNVVLFYLKRPPGSESSPEEEVPF